MGSQRAAGAGARSTDLAPQNRGEGHFIAILEKEKAEGWEDGRKRTYPAYWKDRKALRDYESFLKETIRDLGEDSAAFPPVRRQGAYLKRRTAVSSAS